MFKRTGKKKLGRTHTHRRALVKNQMRSLFATGTLVTTTPKAKVLKANAESLISKVQNGSDQLATVRYLNSVFSDTRVIKAVQEYAASNDVSVSIVKVGFRSGDNAETSKVEVNAYTGIKKQAVKKSKKSATKKSVETHEAEKQNAELSTQEIAKEDKLGSKLAKSFRSRIGSNKGKSTVRSGI